ncbi:hypothetical protein ABZX93_35085 [Streptomyces sp. NPDC006632]|uniref:hypothetical protein n=1 Tax=Streptomyces sp. NPDC006632 TaxID=3157182 RepID=UPI00339DF282
MSTHPNPTTDPTPTQPPAVPAAPLTPPEPSPAEASLRRTLQAVTAAVTLLGLMFAFYVLNEHPNALPALGGVGTLVAIGLGVLAVVKLVNRRP